MSQFDVRLYTDGGCSGNPGPGGWGVILRYNGTERELCGGEADTTNNRMELLAAIHAIEVMKRPVEIHIHTDSLYLRDGITKWIHNWKARGWRTADRKPVKNIDLWKRLDEALRHHKTHWHWVKGHSGHAENERADALARRGMSPFLKSAP